MNKQNKRSLALFVLRDTISLLLKKASSGHYTEESDITSYIHTEATNQNLQDILVASDNENASAPLD